MVSQGCDPHWSMSCFLVFPLWGPVARQSSVAISVHEHVLQDPSLSQAAGQESVGPYREPSGLTGISRYQREMPVSPLRSVYSQLRFTPNTETTRAR